MVFLDNNATSPIDPEVIKAMLIDLDGIPRNPSSMTKYGREAKAMLLRSRNAIAKSLGVPSQFITFTSGGTEANNALIHGYSKLRSGPIITTKIEHKSILEPLKQSGREILYLKVDDRGFPTAQDFALALAKKPAFAFFSSANGETGVKLPLEDFAKLAKAHQTPLLIDAVAHLGRDHLTYIDGVMGMSFSGHKIHGPKGVGFYISSLPLSPLLVGGSQEQNRRAGTENLPAILGLAKAIELIEGKNVTKMAELRDLFEKKLKGYAIKNGHGDRTSNVSNLYFEGVDAETLLIVLDQKGIIASLGSACSAGAEEMSHVLLNMGFKERALSSLRFSLSKMTTHLDIEMAAEGIISSLKSLEFSSH